MVGEAIAVNYYEGDNPRFIKGILLEENDDFIKIELRKYVVTISKKHVIKIEIPKLNHERRRL